MTNLSLIFHGWGRPTIKVKIISDYLSNKGFETLIPAYLESKEEFNIQNVIAQTDTLLAGRKPNVIAGVSLGGLIIPHLALKFPQAKLIFIASGPYFKPKSTFLKIILSVPNTPAGYILYMLLIPIPKRLILHSFKSFYPFQGGQEHLKDYQEDIENNFSYMQRTSFQKHKEILAFLKNTDNTEALKKLKNQAIIFAGTEDPLVPAELGNRLHKLLKNSQLITNDGTHFNAFTKESLTRLGQFLNPS